LLLVASVVVVSVYSKARDQRLAFTQDFQQRTLEREQAGLPPLSWCDELYKFAQSWYGEDARYKAAAKKANPARTPIAIRTASPDE
jgi:uncharacterized protein YkwD